MTEQPMLLQVGYKVAYRQEMTWVVATIAAMDGNGALLELEPIPSLSLEPNHRVNITLADLFPPF